MEAFINYLQQHVKLSESDRQTISECMYIEQIPAKTSILEAGQISKRMGFILEGVVRIYSYDENGNERIHCFHNENQFIGDLESYQNQQVTDKYIQTLTACTVIFFSKENDEYLNQNIPKWPLLVRRLTQAALMDKVNNITQLVHTDAKTKYLDFLKKHADIAQRVPLGDLASYLGIKQQSLSRIRKSITL